MRSQFARLVFELCLLALGLIICSTQSHAADRYKTYRALLIGASGYPAQAAATGTGSQSAKDISLLGPPNDVQVMYETLVAMRKDGQQLFDPHNITVVADKLADDFRKSIEAAGSQVVERPTRANITAAFETLASSASDGDFAYIHLAGHGLQVPALGAALDLEPDGLDEVFAPIDFGPVRETAHGIVIENVISDNDIAGHVAALHERGTFVWLVADICHAGDTLRGGWRERALPPQALGPVFQSAVAKARSEHAISLDAAESASVRAPLHEIAAEQGNAGFVAFYAAQADQTAVEANYPDANSPVTGLLTFSLVKALNTAPPDASYGVIAEAVRAEYDRWGGDVRQPLFEGELKKIALGSTSERPAWIAARYDDDIHLRAGALHNVADDDVVALYPLGLQGQQDKLLTYAVVSDVTPAEARLRPVERDGRSSAAVSELPERMSVVGVARREKLKLRVAMPAPADPVHGVIDPAVATNVAAALAALRAPSDDDFGYEIAMVDPGQPADLNLEFRPDKLCLTRPGASCERYDDYGGLRPSPAIGLSKDMAAGTIAKKLKDSLDRVAQVMRLFELYRVFAASETDDSDEMLDLDVSIVDYGKSEQRAAEGEAHKCQEFNLQDSTTKMLHSARIGDGDTLDGLETAVHCDLLSIRGLNRMDGPVDVSVLHISSAFEISGLPWDGTVRVEANKDFGGGLDHAFSVLTCDSCGSSRQEQQPTGTEYILVIAAAPPLENLQYHLDFRGFAQSGVETRKAGAPLPCEGPEASRRLCELWREMPSEARGGSTPPQPAKIKMWLYRVNVQPPAPPAQLAATP